MKNIIKSSITVLFAITFVSLTSCGGQEKQRLMNQVDSLKQVIEFKQANMDEMTSSLDIVANGLDSIFQQEHIIYMGKDEVSGKNLTQKELKQRVNDLADLIARQRERIAELEDSLSFNSNPQMESLKMVIASLNAQLEEKEKTIEDLKKQVASQRMNIALLNQTKSEMEEHIKMQEDALQVQDEMINEAFYIIGTRKELKEAGVITAHFLQKSKVNLETADLSKLKKIDIRNFSNELEIASKKAVILSHMPEASYSIVQGNGKSILYINDPAQFWSMSRILVIQIK